MMPAVTNLALRFGSDAALDFMQHYLLSKSKAPVTISTGWSLDHGHLVILEQGSLKVALSPAKARYLAEAILMQGERFPRLNETHKLDRLARALRDASETLPTVGEDEVEALVRGMFEQAQGFPEHERAFYRSLGAAIVEPGFAPYFTRRDFASDSFLALFAADRRVEIALIRAVKPGGGAWRRLRDELRARGFRITVICPLGRFRKHLEREGWIAGTDEYRSTNTMTDPYCGEASLAVERSGAA